MTNDKQSKIDYLTAQLSKLENKRNKKSYNYSMLVHYKRELKELT